MSYVVRGVSCADKNQTVERVNPNTSCYRWKINHFSQYSRDPLLCIISPSFRAIDSKVKWFLKLHPNGDIVEKSDAMLFGIYYSSVVNAKAFVKLSIVNVDEVIMDVPEVELELIPNSTQPRFVIYLNNDHSRLMPKRRDVEAPENRILANDCLTVSFDVTFHDPIVKLPISSENKQDSKNVTSQKFNDYGGLLENGKYSDVKFVVDDKEIHVHKAILASHSPVFDAMFQHEMQEKKNSIVTIVDVEYAVMKELFRFIYTDTVTNIELIASDLLAAADKYCIERLKALCEKSLLNSLSVDNALQFLVRAEQCNSANLKKKILDFVVKHGDRVVEKGELVSLPPYLMCEIIRALAQKGNAH